MYICLLSLAADPWVGWWTILQSQQRWFGFPKHFPQAASSNNQGWLRNFEKKLAKWLLRVYFSLQKIWNIAVKGLSGEVQCSARAKRRSRKTTSKTNRAVQGEKWGKMRKGSRLLMANMNLKEQVSVFIFLPSYKLAASVPLTITQICRVSKFSTCKFLCSQFRVLKFLQAF